MAIVTVDFVFLNGVRIEGVAPIAVTLNVLMGVSRTVTMIK